MPSPGNADILSFSKFYIWDYVGQKHLPKLLNARNVFIEFLVQRGFAKFQSEEFAEKNIGRVLSEISEVSKEWQALGIPLPFFIKDQSGSIISWTHPKFEEISRREKISDEFYDVWNWVKEFDEKRLLFLNSVFLYSIGCEKIFITDSPGDCGVDILGCINKGPFKGVTFLVQAKSAQSKVNKESLFSDYTKYLLLQRQGQWEKYLNAIDGEHSHDGIGIIFVFTSNLEFTENIKKAAMDLPIMLRSGKQLAYALAPYGLSNLQSAYSRISPVKPSLTDNLFREFRSKLKKPC